MGANVVAKREYSFSPDCQRTEGEEVDKTKKKKSVVCMDDMRHDFLL